MFIKQSHELPPDNFVYGKHSAKEESVGDIIGKWSASHPSHEKHNKNFLANPPTHPHHKNPHGHPQDLVYGKKTSL